MDLANKLPDLYNDYRKFLHKYLPNSVVYNDISLLELNTVVSSLNNKQSCGPDLVLPYLIKLSKDFIYKVYILLVHIFNLSYSQGICFQEIGLWHMEVMGIFVDQQKAFDTVDFEFFFK